MSKPEISIENRELYPWYIALERNQLAVRLLTTAMGVFRPRVIVGPNLAEEVREHRSQDGVLAINGPHQNITDQFHVARLPRQAPETFGDLEGLARIGAKVPLFRIPILRGAVEQMGAFPAIRPKDYEKILGRELNEDDLKLLKLSKAEYIDASIAMLINGQDLFNFPQGTREKDFSKVKDGMGHIAIGAQPEVNLALMPVGIYYPEFRGIGVPNVIRPTLYADTLIHGPFNSVEDVSELLFTGIQKATAEARERTPDFIYNS